MIKKRTARDYKFIRLLGEGSFSSVYLAVDSNIASGPAAAAAAAATTTTTTIQQQQQDCTNGGSSSITERSRSNNQTSDKSKVDLESRVTTQTTAATTTATTTTTTGTEIRAPTTNATTNNTANKRVRKYAIKVCQKSHIKRQGKQMAIMREKEIMNILNQSQCTHFIRLYCTFQDMERLFFVMSYAKNGELLTYMLEHPLSLDTVRKFTLQLVSALEHLHKLHIVHRDLKPENILLSELLNLLISDFGSAQIYNKPSTPDLQKNQQQYQSSASSTNSTVQIDPALGAANSDSNPRTLNPPVTDSRRNSFVGTAQYVSPEMLKSRDASNKSDLWALGIIIYQMITNVMPFDAPNEYLIYKKIQSLDYKYPDDFDTDARHLVDSLIKLEPLTRLGAKDDLQTEGYQSIRKHKFLSVVDSEQIMTALNIAADDGQWDNIIRNDPDLRNIDKITPGLNETQVLRLLTDG